MRKLTTMLPLAFAVSVAFAQGQSPAGSAERGLKAYLKYECQTCHGTVGQGGERGAGPKLTPNPFPYEAFVSQTRAPRAEMPAYRRQHLSDQELTDMYAYIMSIRPPTPAKDIPLLNF
jgi:mono/diheme cytochrome c family protein